MQNGERFTVKLTDPVQPDQPQRTFEMVLRMDEQGFPEFYRMELLTGICLDGSCNPIDVVLFWNPLGFYTHLQVLPGAPLTKLEHVPFEPEDYEQLDKILKDPVSIVASEPLEWFVGKTKPDDVDAVSAATSTAIPEGAIVPGAVYTTWALWHWVNGPVRDALIAKTKEYCTEDYLLKCLWTDDPRYRRFALRRMEELPEPSSGLWKKISAGLLQVDAYHDVHHILVLLKKRAAGSNAVDANIKKLRGHENRFIARLAEEYLNDEL